MEKIQPISLTPEHKLHSLVEHRSKFNLDFCELNVFETHQKAEDFHLKFDNFTITSMLRGKKVMHIDTLGDFDYVPGETVLAPASTPMRIDFPEAEFKNPTQCTALVIDDHYLQTQLNRLNEERLEESNSFGNWELNIHELILKNNRELADVSSRLLTVFTSKDPFKSYRADLILRELVAVMLKIQNLQHLRKESVHNTTETPFNAVMSYISRQISSEIRIEDLCRIAGMSKSSFYRSFTTEYGVTPIQLILEERLKYAKYLLRYHHEVSIKEVAYASGFNDPNYFSRAFRKMEGMTASEYRASVLH